MSRIYLKLMASLIAVILAGTLVVGVSYAWLTISKSPAVNGINITISGGNTILLAPDVAETITTEAGETVTVHYPGAFEGSIRLGEDLATQAGLEPVSTADGIHWILPEYDEQTGVLKEYSEFSVESDLSHANLPYEVGGGYVYLDFWVVSPGAEYNLRVSMDKKNGQGSYLIELPEVAAAEDGSLHLTQTDGSAQSSARVGFLVNQNPGDTAAMSAYSASSGYDERYHSILGVYQEPGEDGQKNGACTFTIYEPNGTEHPSGILDDGIYAMTVPLGYDAQTGAIVEVPAIQSFLSVQSGSRWRTAENGETQLEQMFQTAILGSPGLEALEMDSAFYGEYLQGQVGPYVESGTFFSSTQELYSQALSGGRVYHTDGEATINMGGATDDVIITQLESNTPQRIRMFLWLEGQDIDCTNTDYVASGRLSLSLELSGATM